MKTQPIPILAAALAALAAVASPPAEPTTPPVTFTWDAHCPSEDIEAFNLYWRTNWPPDMPRTNAPLGEIMLWTPPEQQTGWTLLLTIPGDQTRVTITNTWHGAAFFTLTASNRMGESPFSNVAWIPARPSDQNHLRATLSP